MKGIDEYGWNRETWSQMENKHGNTLSLNCLFFTNYSGQIYLLRIDIFQDELQCCPFSGWEDQITGTWFPIIPPCATKGCFHNCQKRGIFSRGSSGCWRCWSLASRVTSCWFLIESTKFYKILSQLYLGRYQSSRRDGHPKWYLKVDPYLRYNCMARFRCSSSKDHQALCS